MDVDMEAIHYALRHARKKRSQNQAMSAYLEEHGADARAETRLEDGCDMLKRLAREEKARREEATREENEREANRMMKTMAKRAEKAERLAREQERADKQMALAGEVAAAKLDAEEAKREWEDKTVLLKQNDHAWRIRLRWWAVSFVLFWTAMGFIGGGIAGETKREETYYDYWTDRIVISGPLDGQPRNHYSSWVETQGTVDYYIYNITNLEETRAGETPAVEEIGPFRFLRTRHKYNVTFYLGWASYSERSSHQYIGPGCDVEGWEGDYDDWQELKNLDVTVSTLNMAYQALLGTINDRLEDEVQLLVPLQVDFVFSKMVDRLEDAVEQIKVDRLALTATNGPGGLLSEGREKARAKIAIERLTYFWDNVVNGTDQDAKAERWRNNTFEGEEWEIFRMEPHVENATQMVSHFAKFIWWNLKPGSWLVYDESAPLAEWPIVMWSTAYERFNTGDEEAYDDIVFLLRQQGRVTETHDIVRAGAFAHRVLHTALPLAWLEGDDLTLRGAPFLPTLPANNAFRSAVDGMDSYDASMFAWAVWNSNSTYSLTREGNATDPSGLELIVAASLSSLASALSVTEEEAEGLRLYANSTRQAALGVIGGSWALASPVLPASEVAINWAAFLSLDATGTAALQDAVNASHGLAAASFSLFRTALAEAEVAQAQLRLYWDAEGDAVDWSANLASVEPLFSLEEGSSLSSPTLAGLLWEEWTQALDAEGLLGWRQADAAELTALMEALGASVSTSDVTATSQFLGRVIGDSYDYAWVVGEVPGGLSNESTLALTARAMPALNASALGGALWDSFVSSEGVRQWRTDFSELAFSATVLADVAPLVEAEHQSAVQLLFSALLDPFAIEAFSITALEGEGSWLLEEADEGDVLALLQSLTGLDEGVEEDVIAAVGEWYRTWMASSHVEEHILASSDAFEGASSWSELPAVQWGTAKPLGGCAENGYEFACLVPDTSAVTPFYTAMGPADMPFWSPQLTATQAIELWDSILAPTVDLSEHFRFQQSDLLSLRGTNLRAFWSQWNRHWDPYNIRSILSLDNLIIMREAYDSGDWTEFEAAIALRDGTCNINMYRFAYDLSCLQLGNLGQYLITIARDINWNGLLVENYGDGDYRSNQGYFVTATAREILLDGFTDVTRASLGEGGLPRFTEAPLTKTMGWVDEFGEYGRSELPGNDAAEWEKFYVAGETYRGRRSTSMGVGGKESVYTAGQLRAIDGIKDTYPLFEYWNDLEGMLPQENELDGIADGRYYYGPHFDLDRANPEGLLDELKLWNDNSFRITTYEYEGDHKTPHERIDVRRYTLDGFPELPSDEWAEAPPCMLAVQDRYNGSRIYFGAPHYYGCGATGSYTDLLQGQRADGITGGTFAENGSWVDVEPTSGRSLHTSVKQGIYVFIWGEDMIWDTTLFKRQYCYRSDCVLGQDQYLYFPLTAIHENNKCNKGCEGLMRSLIDDMKHDRFLWDLMSMMGGTLTLLATGATFFVGYKIGHLTVKVMPASKRKQILLARTAAEAQQRAAEAKTRRLDSMYQSIKTRKEVASREEMRKQKKAAKHETLVKQKAAEARAAEERRKKEEEEAAQRKAEEAEAEAEAEAADTRPSSPTEGSEGPGTPGIVEVPIAAGEGAEALPGAVPASPTGSGRGGETEEEEEEEAKGPSAQVDAEREISRTFWPRRGSVMASLGTMDVDWSEFKSLS